MEALDLSLCTVYTLGIRACTVDGEDFMFKYGLFYCKN